MCCTQPGVFVLICVDLCYLRTMGHFGWQGLVGGDGGCLDETGISLNTLERAAAAYTGQLELISRSDNAISETLTFGLTNAKQIGKTLGECKRVLLLSRRMLSWRLHASVCTQ